LTITSAVRCPISRIVTSRAISAANGAAGAATSSSSAESGSRRRVRRTDEMTMQGVRCLLAAAGRLVRRLPWLS
jgi:hypothetical protein